MALRFCDSFDHYAIGDILKKWTDNYSAAGSLVSARNGSGLRLGNIQRGYSKTLDSQATWIVGFAFNLGTTLPGADTALVTFIDSATTHADLRLTPSGTLRATRNGTSLGLGTIALSTSTWYYIEVKVTISDTVGVVVAKVNGTTDINLSSQDTRNAANSTANVIKILGFTTNAAVSWDFDDLYILDGTGSAPTNDFLGDIKVEAILPSGNGNSSVLVGSDGNSTDNYLLVDEAAPNSDTDYVESSTVGDKDTYAFGNPTATSGTVYGVQVLPFAEKTDAGVRSIVTVARLAATEVDSAAATLTQNTYLYLPDIREAKPGGGVWTITDVNAAEFGVKVNA